MKRLTLLPLLFLVLLAGCDSSDPDPDPDPGTDPDPIQADVTGEYLIERFSFVPDAEAIRPFDLLDTLVESETRLVLADNDIYLLECTFIGGREVVVIGTYTVTESQIQLEATSGTDVLSGLLFTEDLVLERNADDASSVQVHLHDRFGGPGDEFNGRPVRDIESLARQYAGIEPFLATLHLELRRL